MIATLAIQVTLCTAGFAVGWLARSNSADIITVMAPTPIDPEMAEAESFLATMRDSTQDNIVYVEPPAITAYPHTTHNMSRIRAWLTQQPTAIEGRRKD